MCVCICMCVYSVHIGMHVVLVQVAHTGGRKEAMYHQGIETREVVSDRVVVGLVMAGWWEQDGRVMVWCVVFGRSQEGSDVSPGE